MFAHFVLETSYNSTWERDTNGIEMWRQGLYAIRGCNPDVDNCDTPSSGWSAVAWPP